MKASKIVIWIGILVLICVLIFLYPRKNNEKQAIDSDSKTFHDAGLDFRYPARFTNVGMSEASSSVATFIDSESPLVNESKMIQISIMAFTLNPETAPKSAIELMKESFATVFENLKNKNDIEEYSIGEKTYAGKKVGELISFETVSGQKTITRMVLVKTNNLFYLINGLGLDSDRDILDHAMDQMLNSLSLYDPATKSNPLQ